LSTSLRQGHCNHACLKSYVKGMGSSYKLLLFHTEVRFLGGKLLTSRLLEHRKKIALFLKVKTDLVKSLHNE